MARRGQLIVIALYALVSMRTWVGVERFLIQVKDGDRRKWVGVVIRLDRYERGPTGSSPFWDFLAAAPLLAAVMLWTVLADPPLATRFAIVATVVAMAGVLRWRLAAPLRRASEPERV